MRIRTCLTSCSLTLIACSLTFTAAPARAQSFPDKPIRWIVPYPAGGGSDFLARTIGQSLSEDIKQSVVIDNKPGGNTAIAASDTARAAPDGYTVLSADNGTMVFNSALYKKLSYDPVRDLAPVTLLGRFPMILVVNPASDIKNLKDFVEHVKSSNGSINYGSAGAGSPHHLAMELFKTEAGLKMTHVPYRGAAPSLTDLAGGQVQAMMVDLAAGAGFLKGGKIRPLAVASARRLPQLPDVPTFAESGYPNVEAAALVGMVAPAKTPTDILASLNKSVVAALNKPATHKKLVEFGIEPVGDTPEQYSKLLEDERTRWHKLIKDLNITLD
ncbi:ABC transporter substrate-binding protein [Advenella kashmirensis W13003]|uniref:ABC transporter substrate-binding protein n=1 Tax=Advenella kashmirensis W13003 TaxID=1424334 RepID=V8QWQ3_9BURK|nr:tripartite tricarboxylate transporter substrate binding protein [Advenella kashmirensis]ETF03788.1 ABC transporter substrate-binding protein [Advenella kashmirensis W13003]